MSLPRKSGCRCCSASIFSRTPGCASSWEAGLKPIVDNASADLVATINQHVGELLRAYVAEAIEREIERWRDQH